MSFARNELGYTRFLLWCVVVLISNMINPCPAVVVDATWTGAEDDSWQNPDNWAGVPPSRYPNNSLDPNVQYNVFIPNDASTAHSPELDFPSTINLLTVDVGATLGLVTSLTVRQSPINNDGLISLQPFSSALLLIGAPGIALEGSGVVRLSANTEIRGTAPGDQLIISPTQTISGGGVFSNSFNLLSVTSHGLIEADIPGVRLQVSAPTTNDGLMQATGGGILRFFQGQHQNTGGTIRALADSVVEIQQGAHIVGGTLATSDDGVIRVNNNITVFFEDVALASGSLMEISSISEFIGTFTNDGHIEADLADQNNIRIEGDVTLGGSGTLTMLRGNSSIGSQVTGQYVLTNGEHHTIAGRGIVGASAQMGLDNQGLINANSAGSQLQVAVNASGAINWGVMRASDGGILNLATGSFFNAGGTFEALNGSTLTMSASLSNLAAGTLTGGVYRSIDEGNGATMTIAGPAVHTVGAETIVEVSGANPTMRFGGTDLAASLNTNAGILKLSDDHQFTMTNNYTQTASGAFQVELTSHTNYAMLATGGSATLDGFLEVRLRDGYTPSTSDVFTVLDAASLSGTFGNAGNGHRLNTLGTEGSFLVTYNAGAGTVVLSDFLATTLLPGDYDHDGDVDGRDFLTWQRNPAIGDLADWQANYGMGMFGAASVPEPGCLILTAILGWLPFRRREQHPRGP